MMLSNRHLPSSPCVARRASALPQFIERRVFDTASRLHSARRCGCAGAAGTITPPARCLE
jgi:hypothetical protein